MHICVLGPSPLAVLVVRRLVKAGHRIVYLTPLAEGDPLVSEVSEDMPIEKYAFEGSLRELMEAGKIKESQAFIALSADDNRNAMAAQLAKWMFEIGRCICLIHDPERAEMYNRLGIVAISPVQATMQMVEGALTI
jgi:trk system potassium uptake protein TrkA